MSVHVSSGIPQFRGDEGPLLIRYIVVLTASTQNCLGRPAVSACLSTLQNSPVHALCHSILIRISRNRLHSSDSPTCAELFKSSITVFAPVVGFQALKLLTRLIFDLGQPFLKHLEHIRLVFEEIHPDPLLESLMVIKYNEPPREGGN